MRQQRIRIKMCGTTRIEDAEAAVSCGVDALGFIFAPASPRRVSPERAAALIDGLPPFVSRVGVFVDSTLEEIKAVVEQCGLTHVQLHGTETPMLCRQLKQWRRGCSVCKAFRVGAASPPVDIGAYIPVIDGILLDTYVKGVAGGTGTCFDWTVIAGLKFDRPVILAGGLSPENVQAAVRSVRPYGIDINSGVELAPGIKDHDRLASLVAAVRAVEDEMRAW